MCVSKAILCVCVCVGGGGGGGGGIRKIMYFKLSSVEIFHPL